MKNMILNREDILFHYSSYSFLPSGDKGKIFSHTIIDYIENLLKDSSVNVYEVIVDGEKHLFLTKFLSWDSNYFKIPTYKLLFVLYNHNSYSILRTAVEKYKKEYVDEVKGYFFSEIPSEDILLIQALNESKFKLVETRLTYYLKLNSFSNERYQVREATLDDVENLKRVARLMRNNYDRFHAETVFPVEKADEFLATYIEESIKGFADICLVPDGQNIRPDAFLTSNYLKDQWDKIGSKISKMVLSAVSSDTCKGWYIKLISEMAYHLRDQGAEYAFMHPATTNRAVIHTYEKLGCKYGKCVHVLTCFQPNS
jgi:dTDP-4-amino-4,6-dideoxy-D-galactose acyltransferase